jgi:hypothetical protein
MMILGWTILGAVGDGESSTKKMASWGQAGKQSPMPSQKLGLTSLAFPSTKASAPSWHASMQSPHPLHFDSSICIVLTILIEFGNQI